MADYSIVLRRQTLTPLVSSPRRKRAGRSLTGKVGNGASESGSRVGFEEDFELPSDPTSPFKAPSIDPTADTVTRSAQLRSFIDRMKSWGKLTIYPPNQNAMFSWAAHPVKSFITYAWGSDRPGYVGVNGFGGYSAGLAAPAA